MTENRDYIRLYPGYWLYNAGLVGIIRTLERFVKKEGYGYHFERNSLHVPVQSWDQLKEYYIDLMEELFGKNWFYGKIFGYKDKGIFPNNKLINGLKIKGDNLFNKIDDWLYTNKNFSISKWRLMQWIIFFISNIDRGSIETNLNTEELKIFIETGFKKLKKLEVDVYKFEEEFYNWDEEERKELIKAILNYLALKYPANWSQLWDESGRVKSYVLTVIKNSLLERLKEVLNEKEIKKKGSKKKEKTCSFCGQQTLSEEFFEMKWFSYEGGSLKFNNFYYNDSTQLPICPDCRLVLYFSPLGIFADSDTRQGEFINIPDIRFLWELNHYRMNVQHSRKEEEKQRYGERSTLIDAIVSTGAYLQMKSRWLLQNVEIIEIGGEHSETVYNLDISPIPLKLLGDYTSRSIPLWLNQIEPIKIEQAPKGQQKKDQQKKDYNKNRILTRKYVGFTNGRDIIDAFLHNDTGRLNKISILLFKLYFEKDRASGTPLNDFNRLIKQSLKPILLANLSLLHGKESYSEVYKLGQAIGRLFQARDEKARQEKKDRFESAILPPLFQCVVTLQKEVFGELLLKIYMEYRVEVDLRLVKILKLKDSEFQVESLLLLVGILEEIHHGEKDE